jgi:hypothetical protein
MLPGFAGSSTKISTTIFFERLPLRFGDTAGKTTSQRKIGE